MSDSPHLEELRARIATETDMVELQRTAGILRDFLREIITLLMASAPTKKERYRLADRFAEL